MVNVQFLMESDRSIVDQLIFRLLPRVCGSLVGSNDDMWFRVRQARDQSNPNALYFVVFFASLSPADNENSEFLLAERERVTN